MDDITSVAAEYVVRCTDAQPVTASQRIQVVLSGDTFTGLALTTLSVSLEGTYW